MKSETTKARVSGTLDPIVRCPGCGHEYSKYLYDWQFIFCNDCRTYFEKHTGKRIDCDVCAKVPKRYWVVDGDLSLLEGYGTE